MKTMDELRNARTQSLTFGRELAMRGLADNADILAFERTKAVVEVLDYGMRMEAMQRNRLSIDTWRKVGLRDTDTPNQNDINGVEAGSISHWPECLADLVRLQTADDPACGTEAA